MLSPEEAMAHFPAPPPGSLFSLQKITQEHYPHRYGLGPGHVRWGQRRGIVTLDDVTLREADRDGIPCSVPGCKLSWDRHLVICLWILVPRKILDAREIPGLWEYLLRCQSLARLLGINKFAFPYPGMDTEDKGWIELVQSLTSTQEKGGRR